MQRASSLHPNSRLLQFTLSAALIFPSPSLHHVLVQRPPPPPPPHVLHHLLSPSIMYLLPTSYPIPSHPSPCHPACPGRLQMVLNGRITEHNCFVNNSTGTRWATGQPACVDTWERCTHATHTHMHVLPCEVISASCKQTSRINW